MRKLFSTDEEEEGESAGETNDSDDDDDESLVFPIHEQHITTKIAAVWRERKATFNSNYAITGWILSTIPQVREDILSRMNGSHHDSVESVIKKLYAHDIDIDIGKSNDTFWDKFKQFQYKNGALRLLQGGTL